MLGLGVRVARVRVRAARVRVRVARVRVRVARVRVRVRVARVRVRPGLGLSQIPCSIGSEWDPMANGRGLLNYAWRKIWLPWQPISVTIATM